MVPMPVPRSRAGAALRPLPVAAAWPVLPVLPVGLVELVSTGFPPAVVSPCVVPPLRAVVPLPPVAARPPVWVPAPLSPVPPPVVWSALVLAFPPVAAGWWRPVVACSGSGALPVPGVVRRPGRRWAVRPGGGRRAASAGLRRRPAPPATARSAVPAPSGGPRSALVATRRRVVRTMPVPAAVVSAVVVRAGTGRSGEGPAPHCREAVPARPAARSAGPGRRASRRESRPAARAGPVGLVAWRWTVRAGPVGRVAARSAARAGPAGWRLGGRAGVRTTARPTPRGRTARAVSTVPDGRAAPVGAVRSVAAGRVAAGGVAVPRARRPVRRRRPARTGRTVVPTAVGAIPPPGRSPVSVPGEWSTAALRTPPGWRGAVWAAAVPRTVARVTPVEGGAPRAGGRSTGRTSAGATAPGVRRRGGGRPECRPGPAPVAGAPADRGSAVGQTGPAGQRPVRASPAGNSR
ncbi:hypothetical protein GA0070623_5716 [Micromonospora rifamycinica]|uniref:Uncharacterized protein n=1 Tax=Micromonospora rifamycinica TaxID=291594 RepID=A0A1C5KF14_9ACTN|nr:hypothetical protein GA0070623_5716 [Micromonospora rifamycinica]